MSKQTSQLTKHSAIKIIFSRKFRVFGILSVSAYLIFFSQLFGSFLALQSMIYILLFFIFFHFFYLELRNIPIKYLIILMLIVSAGEALFIGLPNGFLVASLLTINTGIVMLAYFLQGESHDKIVRRSVGYFNVGGYIFTVFITIGYSLFVFGYYSKFPFTCQDLSAASNRVINFFTRPVAEGVTKIKTDTTALFNTKVKDIAVIGQDISLQTQQSSYSKIIETFNVYKKNFIDQTLKDNTAVNMGICDYLLGQMNKIYSDPAFKTSVILLMFLLLYSFIRIVFWVMTGIALVIFKILFGLKVYHISTIMKEVEDLK